MLARGITGQWQPGQLNEEHFRTTTASGEIWLAEADGRTAGAWELWWQDEAPGDRNRQWPAMCIG
jgi:hypothetical protein